jgi:peptidoglycan/xylan/chitin deacetylase (PgdA/CDA1 family)
MAAGSVRSRVIGTAAAVLLALGACSSGAPAPPSPASSSRPPPGSPVPPRSSAPPRPTATPSGVPVSLRGAEWERLPTQRHVVALTFDAGANADAVEPILAALAANGVPATFFLTGEWVQRYPDQARRVARLYPVGNHSQTHPALTTLPDARVDAEVHDAAAAITAATGHDPRPLFRFPFGDRNAHTIQLVNAAGYGSIRWTVDTTGWKGTSGGMSAALVVQRVLAQLSPGEIVLMHVGSHPTDGSRLDADALPEVIRQIRARGYEFAAITDFL